MYCMFFNCQSVNSLAKYNIMHLLILITYMLLIMQYYNCYCYYYYFIQVELSPRRIDGVGLTDGEGVERLWAYLRGYSAMTKEMGAEKRIDVLTQALLFYAQRLFTRFGMICVIIYMYIQ